MGPYLTLALFADVTYFLLTMSIMLDACMTTDSYIRAVICRCTACIYFLFYILFRLCIY